VIDLAGLASQVTLIEFDPKLRADDVLQAKLRSLTNVSAQTTEVFGDGTKVIGLACKDRMTGAARRRLTGCSRRATRRPCRSNRS